MSFLPPIDAVTRTRSRAGHRPVPSTGTQEEMIKMCVRPDRLAGPKRRRAEEASGGTCHCDSGPGCKTASPLSSLSSPSQARVDATVKVMTFYVTVRRNDTEHSECPRKRGDVEPLSHTALVCLSLFHVEA